jgi:predicted ester cyclase
LAFLGFVEHDKVVTRALHFGESDAHARIIGLAPRPKRVQFDADVQTSQSLG